MPFTVPQQAQPQAQRQDDPWQQQPSRSQPQQRAYRQPQQRSQYQPPMQYGGRGQMQQATVEPRYRQPQRQGIMRGEWDQPQYGWRGQMQQSPRGYRGMEYAPPPPKQYAAAPPQKQYMSEAPVPSYGASLIQSNSAPASGIYSQPGFQTPLDIYGGDEIDAYDKMLYGGGY